MAPPSLNLRVRKRKRPKLISNPDDGPRPRGRPMMSAKELRMRPQQRMRGPLKQAQASGPQPGPASAQSRRSMQSPLEQLPVELIQQMFFYSLEVSMVKASPVIMQALSNDTIYQSLILFSFFDDDGEHPVEVKHFKPAQYRFLETGEKIRLQRDILKCRWCSLKRVQDCLPMLTRLKMVQEWHAERGREQPYGTVGATTEIVSDWTAVAFLPELDDQESLERHFFASKNEFDIGENLVLTNRIFPRIITWSYNMAGTDKVRKSLGISPTILAARHIPQKLLSGRGSWSGEKLEFLQLLRQGHRFIQSEFYLDIDADALFQGMRRAISENNREALLMLLDLHYTAFRRDRFTMDNFQPGHYATAFAHPIPLDLFHLAVRKSPDTSNMLATLLREGIDSIPADDPVLTKWALTAHGDGGQLAGWLLKHMEGTQDYGLGGHDSPLFINGELNPHRADGDYPFPDRSFTAELGYITHGAVAFIPQSLEQMGSAE